MFDPAAQRLMEQQFGGQSSEFTDLPLSSPNEQRTTRSTVYTKHTTAGHGTKGSPRLIGHRHTPQSSGRPVPPSPSRLVTKIHVGDDDVTDGSSGRLSPLFISTSQNEQPYFASPKGVHSRHWESPVASPRNTPRGKLGVQEGIVFQNASSSNYSSPRQGYSSSSHRSNIASPARSSTPGKSQKIDDNQNWTNKSTSVPMFLGDHMSSLSPSAWAKDSSFDQDIPVQTSSPAMMSPRSGGSAMSSPRGQLHSPGAHSDVSFESLPSVYMSPYPQGKAPIEIQVQSPTDSNGYHDLSGVGEFSDRDGMTSSHHVREVRTQMPSPRHGQTPPKEKKFLKKIQKELDEQRTQWKDDVDALTGGLSGLGLDASPNGVAQGSNSYIDTSDGKAVFRAMVDVTGYLPSEIHVSVDKLTSKVIVRAAKTDHNGHATRTFTQKVQLPRFADDFNLRSRLSKTGQLKIEVPLIYYFENTNKKGGRQAKSFVYQVKTGRDGHQRLEILVNTGSGYRAADLKVQVHDENKLVIIGEKRDLNGHPKKKLIKQYSLPGLAIVDKITCRLGKDGRLQVNVPLADRKH